ncbi:MAG: DUF2493 domain-containing protein [Clostridia bacterium]|nr:DUF2493 domain-containing protein [Clostridia bacterium]
MNIVICGSRNFNNYEYFSKSLDEIFASFINDEISIITGHCKGVDMMAERYAAEHNINLILCPASWEIYGRAAGPVRNKEMAEMCNMVIAFWDGSSRGTFSMINLATKLGREVVVKNFLTDQILYDC